MCAEDKDRSLEIVQKRTQILTSAGMIGYNLRTLLKSWELQEGISLIPCFQKRLCGFLLHNYLALDGVS